MCATAVPGRKYSVLGASRPPSKTTSCLSMPEGGGGGWLPCSRCSQSMTSCQIGAAPVTPETLRMLAPLLLPTHTPTVKSLDQPSVQLSRMSLLVPVFTAVQNRVASTLSRPNPRALACLSERISPTSQAAIASMTCLNGLTGCAGPATASASNPDSGSGAESFAEAPSGTKRGGVQRPTCARAR